MALDTKYRPPSLAQCIGHAAAVQRLQGFVKSGRTPSLMLITGPTSAGKTTLGRAYSADLNGYNSQGLVNDYQEVDGGQYRTKEELTTLVRTASFLPQVGKRRIILIDEFQHVLGNPQAVPVLLKATEEPSPKTIWIFCTMDAAKLQSDKNGKAILTRAVQLPLAQHSDEELFKQGVRIVKGEKFNFMSPDLLKIVVRESNHEMRTLAHNLESLAGFHAGLKTPRKLTEKDLPELLKTATEQTDDTVLRYLSALYAGSFSDAVKAILDIEDEHQFVNQALWAAKFMLHVAVLNGSKHRKVWWTPLNKALHARVGKMSKKPNLGSLAAAVTMLVGVKAKVAFGNLDDTLTAATYQYLSGKE